MISKNEVKYIQTLYHKKMQDEENVFVVEGRKMVTELLQSNFTIKKIYALKNFIAEMPCSSAFCEVQEEELKKISRMETPNQAVAVVEKKFFSTKINWKQIILVLDCLQDPGNLGTIIRIADWFGLQQIIASENSADCYNPKVVQATMGSIFRINIQYQNLEKFLSAAQTKVYGALLQGKNIQQQSGISEGVLVIGNESKGISENIKPYISEALAIPTFGKAESLNAAVAAGIILSHLIKK